MFWKGNKKFHYFSDNDVVFNLMCAWNINNTGKSKYSLSNVSNFENTYSPSLISKQIDSKRLIYDLRQSWNLIYKFMEWICIIQKSSIKVRFIRQNLYSFHLSVRNCELKVFLIEGLENQYIQNNFYASDKIFTQTTKLFYFIDIRCFIRYNVWYLYIILPTIWLR